MSIYFTIHFLVFSFTTGYSRTFVVTLLTLFLHYTVQLFSMGLGVGPEVRVGTGFTFHESRLEVT